MELDQVKLAIIVIGIIEMTVAILSFFSKGSIDVGIVSVGIAAIAGLAGYDMKKQP